MTQMPINKRCRHKSPQEGEAGFTLIEMIIVIVISSILGIFIFGVLTKCLVAQRDMQVRKERADDAIQVLEKISREVREAKTINSTGSDILIFEKNVTSSTDTNKFVKFIRNTSTNRLRRQSAATLAGLPGNSTSGDIIAENVTEFNVSAEAGIDGNRVVIDTALSSGSEWETKIYPRNYSLNIGGSGGGGSGGGGSGGGGSGGGGWSDDCSSDDGSSDDG